MSLFRTKDMAMAAYLASHGHWYQDIARVHPRTKQCVWAFLTTGNLLELVHAFGERTGLVEPMEFTDALAKVRTAMYEFLDGNHGTHS